MKIFKDSLNGAEVLSDIFAIETINNGLIYKVKGKLVTQSEGADFDIGANASAEEAADSAEGTSVSGINVAINHQLQEAPMDKKGFGHYIKDYMKCVKVKVEERKGDVEKFMKEAQTFVKSVLSEFKEYQFFTSEKTLMEGSGMYVFVRWDGEIPYLYYFADGLEEEKV